MFSFYNYYPAHQNREENVNKNVSLNHSHPQQRRQKFDQSKTSTRKHVFYEISVNAYVLMFPRYFRYSIGSTGRIHRDWEAIEALTVFIHAGC